MFYLVKKLTSYRKHLSNNSNQNYYNLNERQILYLVILLFSNSFVQAQITAKVYPNAGTQLQIISCNSIDPLKEETGLGAIWDYSGLQGCEQEPWIVTFHYAEGSEEAEKFSRCK